MTKKLTELKTNFQLTQLTQLSQLSQLMAFLQTIKNFFVLPAAVGEPETILSAPPTVYEIRMLTAKHLKEVLQLNLRCFKNGENYTKHTFSYLLDEPNTLSYRIVTAEGEMAGFIFIMTDTNGAAHLTTIGVAPEHRRRGLGEKLLAHVEQAAQNRSVSTIMLEVRVSNTAAQKLYVECGYSTVQRVGKYYNNGEDCFLMVKSLL